MLCSDMLWSEWELLESLMATFHVSSRLIILRGGRDFSSQKPTTWHIISCYSTFIAAVWEDNDESIDFLACTMIHISYLLAAYTMMNIWYTTFVVWISMPNGESGCMMEKKLSKLSQTYGLSLNCLRSCTLPFKRYSSPSNLCSHSFSEKTRLLSPLFPVVATLEITGQKMLMILIIF